MRQAAECQSSRAQKRGKVFTQAFSREPALTTLPILPRPAGKPKPIAKVRLVTLAVRTAILNHEQMPALVLSNGSRENVFYDLTIPPPVRRTAQPGTVTWRDGSNWKHSSVIGSYTDAELELILAYLRSAVRP
jgi:hypothetical protein